MAKICIRCENINNGKGIFFGSDYDWFGKELKDLNRRHHDPVEGYPVGNREEVIYNFMRFKEYSTGWYNFGFKSIEDFKKYVKTDELLFLIEKDFRVFYIRSESAVESNYQVVFDKQTVISKIDITELFI